MFHKDISVDFSVNFLCFCVLIEVNAIFKKASFLKKNPVFFIYKELFSSSCLKKV